MTDFTALLGVDFRRRAPATRAEIARLEKALGVLLPLNYKDFLAWSDGARAKLVTSICLCGPSSRSSNSMPCTRSRHAWAGALWASVRTVGITALLWISEGTNVSLSCRSVR
ncbi:SMI1/KNR4 family protein [Burkholderia multivorans]|uniref:SMI1/KNR4 family protein n=1 Tax=Burkholderia multivorans TaxID=87883 RepID=UPI0020B279DF|nr:SMI1/KNR4 family protein [Burkholderia multivorans]